MGEHEKRQISPADVADEDQKFAMANGLLAQARRENAAWERAEPGSRTETEAAERVTSAWCALDDWLSHGGLLPQEWCGIEPEATGDLANAEARLYMAAVKSRHGEPSPAVVMQAFRLAFRALQDRACEVARLKAQLDAYESRTVRFGLERYIQSKLSDGEIAPELDGTILRATDSGKEWECQDGQWRLRK